MSVDGNKIMSVAAAKVLYDDLRQRVNNKLETNLKGIANGLAELDSTGKVPASQLPSYVDDVLEFATFNNFPATGENGKIYIALDTNLTYRWSGSTYTVISSSLALGETASTAYRGDRGAIAYNHANNKGNAYSKGLYKITTNAEGHVINTQNVIKQDITNLGIPGAVPTKVSQLQNDSGFISSYTETDPTVPSWAKASKKPTYTASEVGALPDTTVIPSKVSDLQNDAGYLTAHQDISGKANIADIPTKVSDLIDDSGHYIKPNSGIPASDLATGVIPNISTKADKVSNATNGNFAALDANGNLTDSGAKASDFLTEHQSLTGYVTNTDYATSSVGGVVKVNTSQGIGINDQDGTLYVQRASDYYIKTGSGTAWANPIVPMNQHTSVFYGLAKAAGDTSQSSSSNAVGTYTSAAKTAIQTMLGVENGVSFVETITGSTPTITGVANTRYVCGEVTSISITPPNAGTIIVRFTSGSTVAVLTLPNTVKMPEWFDATSLETNHIYELCIEDGMYGSVMVWPT